MKKNDQADTTPRAPLVYADWCGPCKAIAPLYEQLSAQLSRPNRITFTKVNTDQQTQIAQKHGVRAYVLPLSRTAASTIKRNLTHLPSLSSMPTFLIFKHTKEVSRIQGANPKALSEAVKKLAAEADSDSGSSSGGFGDASSSSSHWLGAEIPKGYGDVTAQVDVRGLDLLNADPAQGNARVLFAEAKPGKEKEKDWVESDTGKQVEDLYF